LNEITILQIVFEYFHFPALFCPTKLNRPTGKAKANYGLPLRAATTHGTVACGRTPLYSLDAGVGQMARHQLLS
jgi:hypothetical protein